MATKGTKDQSNPLLVDFFKFFGNRQFWKTVLHILIFFIVITVGTLIWLNSYTRHGQKIELPDYTGIIYEDAQESAKAKSFRMSITDSVHIVGKPGHQILQQNPTAGSLVKEQRTIYVTITKQNPDQIPLNRLPQLYGKNYHRKKRELQNSFQITSKIVGKRFDPGQPDHILGVIYRGDTIIDSRARKEGIMIEKGGTLEFILSERSGARIPIPDLICKTYSEAQFLLESIGLSFGEVLHEESITDSPGAYISSQTPSVSDGNMLMGSSISVSLIQEKPTFCDVQ